MNKRAFFILLMLASALFGGSRAQGEPPPYLYYYSPLLNGFVIERADGTDSRIIGAGMTPPDERAYPTPGWSPSGKWLAWVSVIPVDEPVDVAYQPWGISADNTRRISLLDNILDTHSMVWSPTEDLLFLITRTRRGELADEQGLLIDPQADRFITSFELGTEYYNISKASWTPDGQYVTYYYSVYSRTQPRRQFLRAISKEGQIVDRKMSELGIDELYWTRPLYSSKGWLLYATPDRTKLVADNLMTGARHEFDMPPGDIYDVEWSTSGDYAALTTRMRCSECPYNLWLLSPAARLLEKVSENIVHHIGWIERAFWSPTEDIGVFTTPDGVMHLLKALSLEVTDVKLPTETLNQELPANLTAFWFPSGDRLLIPHIRQVRQQNIVSYIYELATDRLNLFQYDGHSPLISADERYVASLFDDPAIFNLRSDKQVFLPRHSGTYYWDNLVGLYFASWHPTEAWVFGGVAHRLSTTHLPTSVINAEVTFQRELGNCSGCVRWLPLR